MGKVCNPISQKQAIYKLFKLKKDIMPVNQEKVPSNAFKT